MRLTTPLAYEPRPGPLGVARPWIAALFLLPLAVAAFTFANPIVLLAAGVAALVAGVSSGAGPSLRMPLRWSVGLGVMVIVVNGITSQRGATILVRGFDLPVLGQIDISLEALAEGAVLALRIVVALIVFAVWSACVDPDRILRAIRPIASRSALTATLIARLVPLAAADAARIGEAAALRGPAAAPVGRSATARQARLRARSIAPSTSRRRSSCAATASGSARGCRGTVASPGEVSLVVCGLISLAARRRLRDRRGRELRRLPADRHGRGRPDAPACGGDGRPRLVAVRVWRAARRRRPSASSREAVRVG